MVNNNNTMSKHSVKLQKIYFKLKLMKRNEENQTYLKRFSKIGELKKCNTLTL